MNKQIKLIINIFLILLTIFIPLSFLLKFNKYEEVIVFNKNEDKYLLVQKDTYKKISNFNYLNLMIDNQSTKVFVKHDWQKVNDLGYVLKINLNQYIDEQKVKVFVSKKNIYGF